MESLNVNKLIDARELLKDEDYDFFDDLFRKENELLKNKQNISLLLNGLTDSALDFSYMSDLLTLIRRFMDIVGVVDFTKIIFDGVLIVIPHGKHWYYHLIMDCIKESHKLEKTVIVAIFESLSNKKNSILIDCLLAIKNDGDYGMSQNIELEQMIQIGYECSNLN